eukprot:NODE_127_length_17034_cov_0.369590.p15 type:complete len:141 gc:universal NODE_127_length_17034_cov_0.369590:4494-4916(+)
MNHLTLKWMSSDTNIHYVFQGAPQDTTFIFKYSFCSPELKILCNEFPNLSFKWNTLRTALILNDDRTLLFARRLSMFSYKMKIRNMLTSEDFCEIALVTQDLHTNIWPLLVIIFTPYRCGIDESSYIMGIQSRVDIKWLF